MAHALQEILLTDPKVGVQLLGLLLGRVEHNDELVFIVFTHIFVSTYKLLKLLSSKCCVSSRKGLLLEHLFHSFLKSCKSLALFEDVSLFKISNPLVNPVFDSSFMLFGNFHSFSYLSTNFFIALVVTDFQTPTNALAAELEEVRILGATCSCLN